MDATAAWTAVGAFGTLAAACVAAVAAWQSRESSRQANAAATALAAIERDRRHDELTPEFDLAFIPLDGDQAKLKVTLTGGGMDSLANVILTILNEDG